jgi:type III restriction enzyme
VAELVDGRILAVEYKGEHLVTAEDAEEKDLIGRLWAARSDRKCLFLMATKRDSVGRDVHAQISDAVRNDKK